MSGGVVGKSQDDVRCMNSVDTQSESSGRGQVIRSKMAEHRVRRLVNVEYDVRVT